MDNIIKLINETNWATRTKANRISFIKQLKNSIDPNSNSANFLKNFDLVSKEILKSTANPSSRKTKILVIKAILKLYDERASNKYNQLVETLIGNSDEYRGNNVVNVDKWINYEDLLKIPSNIEANIKYVYDKLFLDFDEIDNLKSIKAKHKYLRMLTDYIVSVLYCWQPPVRADWGVVVLKPSKFENWYDANKGIIHWNDFKNVKSFGPRSFKLDKVIKDNLNEYLSILKYVIDSPTHLLYVFSNNTAKNFSREKFSIYFIRIMDFYTKKKLSINDFRHIYENHIINDPKYNTLTINEKKLIHDRLLHGWKTSQEYLKVEK